MSWYIMLFSREKSPYKHQPLERYKGYTDGAKLFGETDQYSIHVVYKRLSDEYQIPDFFLRQDKQHPKRVVYLGKAHIYNCLFHNKILSINGTSNTGRGFHPLYCIDVETGERTEMDILSRKMYYIQTPFSLHYYCQDVVKSMEYMGDAVVLSVTRYKENANNEEEFAYRIHIRNVNGRFVAEMDHANE